MPEPLVPIVTCEHASYRIPPAYQPLFRDAAAVLASHRGYDIGALGLARRLARTLGSPLFSGAVSRLLVDLNRSCGHRRLFSEFSRPLAAEERQAVLQRYYHPYRDAIGATLRRLTAEGHTVLHLSIHSFTPVLDGRERWADIGLLYDPSRREEREFCRRWQKALQRLEPELKIGRNTPYRGASDALVTALRRRFPESHYLGLELEVNQKFPQQPQRWLSLQRSLIDSLLTTLEAGDEERSTPQEQRVLPP